MTYYGLQFWDMDPPWSNAGYARDRATQRLNFVFYCICPDLVVRKNTTNQKKMLINSRMPAGL